MILSKLIWFFRTVERKLSDNAYRHGQYLIGQGDTASR